ncbi:bifunctional serine/threonine-protein kinase/ABC transporter substrate-binding protein [Nocardia tenerifensis]|uniref:bifunctional serine/threonine-protein kinase/ABC transporter substrate-binding protein n=1 Tax=Nocardia tenerifensis TaxID=228006 RepID=UPI0002D9EEDA
MHDRVSCDDVPAGERADSAGLDAGEDGMLRAGEVFAGFVIERQLGSGGMGSVYLARHPRLPRRIALKLLSPDLHANDEMRARFEREAELVARLDHPNIVAVYDRGVDEGVRWISMQYVDGIDAGALDLATLERARAVEIVAETAKALDYAHAVGVVHRDVKPANILLARATAGQDERVLLTDFGIARLRDDAHQLTRTGTFAATLAYASPEQLSASPVDHRADQYALACTLFWLLTGTAPFTGDNPAAMIAGHLQHPPPPISGRRADLPSALDDVLATALAKRPGDRFDSCSRFATAVREALTGPPGAAAIRPAAPTVPQTWVPPSDVAGAGVPREQTTRTTATDGRTLWEEPGGRASWTEPNQAESGKSRPAQRGPRNIGIAGAALLVVSAIVIGVVWANTDSSSDNTASRGGQGTPQAIEWSGALAPGTAGAPRALEALTQIDQQGKEVAKPSAAITPAGDGHATCAPVAIATTAGTPHSVYGGMKLAVDQFSEANPDCHVKLRVFDLGGAEPAADVAARIVRDPSIAALIGPVFSTEIQRVGEIFDDAGLPFLTPSATDPALSTNGWHSFFRGLAADDAQGTALAKYLVNTAHFRKICVIQDRSGYGRSLSGSAVSSLGSAADPSCAVEIGRGERDFASVTAAIAAAAPDAVFYSGFAEEAAALLPQLRRASVTAPFISAESTVTPDFLAQAGDSASGAIVSCSCAPVVTRFAADYQALNGRPPGPSSVEAYDLTTILLKGITSAHANRTALADYLRAYQGPGLARDYQWSATGDLATPRTWLYKVD